VADPVRVVLFGMSLGALAFSSLAWVGAFRLGAVGSVLALWVAGAATAARRDASVARYTESRS
jgi:hypothetical protein